MSKIKKITVNDYIVKDLFYKKTSEKEWEIFAKDISYLVSSFCDENARKNKDNIESVNISANGIDI